MKKRIPSFLAGMATMALVGSLTVTTLAATGMMNISVSPMRIQVNGEVFIGRDAQGNEVPVFSYNGTTYAPLRALAESFGLTVGYDKENDLATVTGSAAAVPSTTPAPAALSEDYSTWSKEDEAAYQEFKGMWTVDHTEYYFSYIGPLSDAQFKEMWNLKYNYATRQSEYGPFIKRLATETLSADMYSYEIYYGDRNIVGSVAINFQGEVLYTVWGA